MEPDPYPATRRALHAVAELLLAGPQHAACEHIRLQVVPGGFATAFEPHVAVIGADVVRGDTRIGIDGRSIHELAEALGLAWQDLAHVYRDVTGQDADETLAVDCAAAEEICSAYAVGDAALRAFAPAEDPILWPEHFDLAITVDEVNYGVSPGDAGIERPYMYVGPWSVPERDDFWDQSFGAARPLAASAEEVAAFFRAGRDRIIG